jgi:hypothetical protein
VVEEQLLPQGPGGPAEVVEPAVPVGPVAPVGTVGPVGLEVPQGPAIAARNPSFACIPCICSRPVVLRRGRSLRCAPLCCEVGLFHQLGAF